MKRRKLKNWVKVVLFIIVAIICLKGCNAISTYLEKEDKEAFEYCTKVRGLSANYCNRSINGTY